MEELPKFIEKFDVCLNIFKKGKLTTSVNPLKVYEYLASGKPIVSCFMPEIEHFSEVINFTDGVDNFCKAIIYEIETDSEIKKQKRKDIVKEYDWTVIFQNVIKLINENL